MNWWIVPLVVFFYLASVFSKRPYDYYVALMLGVASFQMFMTKREQLRRAR